MCALETQKPDTIRANAIGVLNLADTCYERDGVGGRIPYNVRNTLGRYESRFSTSKCNLGHPMPHPPNVIWRSPPTTAPVVSVPGSSTKSEMGFS